ncbi:MAG: anti-sigma factor antagonist [Actinobacteria bacterium]|nr:MAG: anti-sigma factor antagonist [Actinomycetota bacterium]
MDLRIESNTVDGVAVLGLKGEVDVYTAPKLKSSLIDLVDEGSYDIVVDLSDVDFIDSSGLGVLVGGLKRVKSHEGSISLVCSQENILKIFRITGLNKVFPIYSTLEEATREARQQ